MRLRHVLIGLTGALVVPLSMAATAWACTSLATIETSSPSGSPGQTVQGTGSGFSKSSINNVELHWDGRAGQVLWSGRAGVDGRIGPFAFTVPDATAGSHVLVATQNDNQNQPVSGTPARASFEVVRSDAGAANTNPAAAPQQPVVSNAAQPSKSPASPVVPARQANAAVSAPAVAPVASSAAAPAPSPAQAPAARRSVTVAPAAQGSLVLPLALVGIGLLLSLGTATSIVASRRERPALAGRRRG